MVKIPVAEVPPGAVTCTGPVTAPTGTVTLISVPPALTVKPVAATPLKKVTAVVPVKLFPEMVMGSPTAAEVGAKVGVAKVGALVGVMVKAELAGEVSPPEPAVRVKPVPG